MRVIVCMEREKLRVCVRRMQRARSEIRVLRSLLLGSALP